MIQKVLLLIGVICLGLWGFFTVQARIEQSLLEDELSLPPRLHVSASVAKYHLREGDLFGRLEVPRLSMSVMVMEGIASRTLRLGAGHIPGTPMAFAGHRDSFFRALKDVKVDDTIRLTTPDGVTDFRVISTKVVPPNETSVLDDASDKTMVLVTCYPFYFIGPAPKRFIVEAVKN
jgi:LPXTG-site transpeptidase (sortase) family protein